MTRAKADWARAVLEAEATNQPTNPRHSEKALTTTNHFLCAQGLFEKRGQIRHFQKSGAAVHSLENLSF
jgi:hypothetical protein